MSQNPNLSVCIITKNEGHNLAACLLSLPPSSEIIVLDSGSSDNTLEIAHSFGAKVSVRPFDHYAAQKNAAVALATRTWVLSIDADERLSPELRACLSDPAFLDKGDEVLSYRLTRKLVFMSKTLAFGKTSDCPTRLFRRGQARFEGAIHEALISHTPPGKIPVGYIEHHSYRDLSDYFERFNRYTSLVAEEHLRKKTSTSFWALVLRPWVEFSSRYIFRGGFLDGYPGYTFALISSFYAFTKYAKLKELVDLQTKEKLS